MGGDEIIREQEEREANREVLIQVGFLKRCDIDVDEVLDAELGDDEDAYEAAEKLGVSRERVKQLVDEHGADCAACAHRDDHG